MKIALTLAWLSAATFALSACSQDKPAGQDTAGGEILSRSVGDDMLPYDTVRSQPPLAPSPTASGKGSESAASDAADDAEGAGENAPAADAQPAASGAAEATPSAQ